MSISFILITFLLQLAVGMTVAVALLPPQLIDQLFFKSISFWAWLFTAAALALRYRAPFHLPEIFGQGSQCSILTIGSQTFYCLFGLLNLVLWWRLRFQETFASRFMLFLIAGTGLLALVLDSLLFRPNLTPLWTQNLLIPLHFVSSALLLGGFLAGMIFGHYYLVNTEMPKKLLVTMASILIAVLAFRILAVGSTLLLYKEVVRPDVDFLSSLVSLQGHGIFFWQRVLVGLLIPSVVVFLIWSTARIGSNQSATGIMYVAIAFVFIGELAARYLFLLSAIPL